MGRKKSINISNKIITEKTIDLKSRLGYLSEFSTAYYLSDIINNSGGRLSNNSMVEYFGTLYNTKKTEIESLGADVEEIKRMDSAGKVMASQIWDDIILNSEDLLLLEFEIELTGDTAKGISKADLVLTVSKDSKSVVIDKISASLKAYKTSSINLSNSTFISIIKTLFYTDVSSLPKNTNDFMLKFINDFGSEAEIKKLYDLQNIIAQRMKMGDTKEVARKYAKSTHIDVIGLLTNIFHTHYLQHKKEVNERMLKMLGFDGDDDFYAAIGKANNQKVISARKSKEFKIMLDKLSAGFDLTMERNKNTNNANVLFTSPTGEQIIKINITFADTGGPSAQGKTNAFFDFKYFLS